MLFFINIAYKTGNMKRFRRIYGALMIALAATAFVLSLILTLHSFSVMGLIGCSAGSSCDIVTGSKWSLILGFLPVSSLSMGLYLAVLVCCVYLMFYDDVLAKKLLLGISVATLLGSLWFIYLQEFKLGAFCPYCMSAHSCGIIMSIIALIWYYKEEKLSFRSSLPSLAFASGAVALFIVFQLLTTPAYRSRTGSGQEPLPIPDPSSAPHIGPTDAKHTIALLYDYQCPHCKTIHSLLEEVVERMDGRVVFVLCPTPLSPSCNAYIPSGQDRFPGSCTMAKTALGIWKHDPHRFELYDSWLWEEIRTEEECMAKAAEICPEASFNDSWTQQYLAASLEIFARTTTSGMGGIPRLVCGNSWAMPEVDDAESLTEIVEDLLGQLVIHPIRHTILRPEHRLP